MGSEAVLALMRTRQDNAAATVIVINGNEIKEIPLKESVEKTQFINWSLKDKNSNSNFIGPEMRSWSFSHNLETYIKMSKLEHTSKTEPFSKLHTLGVIHVGSSTCGVNSVIRSFVRQAIARRCKGMHSKNYWQIFMKN